MTSGPARGYDDWGVPVYQSASKGTDPALATEFGFFGFGRLEGTGRPVIADAWRDGLEAWTLANIGSALDPALYGDGGAFVPPAYVKLNAGAGAANDASYMTREQIIGDTARLGIEFAINFQTVDPNFRGLIYYQGATGNKVGARFDYNKTNRTWSINLTGPVTQNILALDSRGQWLQVKFVIEISGASKRWLYARFGDTKIDLSQYTLVDQGSTSNAGLMYLELAAVKNSAVNETARLGYVVITKDEPE